MAFIPIDAKADIEGSKKGKLTPAQHAQLNAWCLASKTGILDCLDKCETEFSSYIATNYKATVVFKKGYIVICGRLVECEAGTKVEVITPVNGEISGKIILRYSLSAVKEDEFVVETKVGSLRQQDLNDNPLTGIYEFELYSYKATPTTVTLTRTNTDYVPDIGGKLSQFEKSLTDEGKPLGGYDTSKGTIEERLTALGFKEGSVEVTSGNATINNITREGNRCILNLAVDNIIKNNFPLSIIIGRLPDNFKGKKATNVACYCNYWGIIGQTNGQGKIEDGLCTVSIHENGDIVAHDFIVPVGNWNMFKVNGVQVMNFGYIL